MRNHKKSISLTTKERAFPLLVFELICHSRKDLPLIFMIGKNSEFWGLFTAEFFFSAKFSKGSQKLVIYLSSDIKRKIEIKIEFQHKNISTRSFICYGIFVLKGNRFCLFLQCC